MSRAARGSTANLSGAMAEDAVLRVYRAAGAEPLARRWRGAGAEIDLVLRLGATFVFVEVKAAPTHEAAALRIGPAQIRRIMTGATAFLAAHGHPQEVPMRFDAALVDAAGRVEIREGALGGF